VQWGEKAGLPRFKGRDRYHPFTFKEYGNGAHLDNGLLALSKIGRIAVRWSRPIEGAPKTVTLSKEADGWYVVTSCADVLAHLLPPTGQETGNASSLLATTARRKRTCGAASDGCRGARRGATAARRR